MPQPVRGRPVDVTRPDASEWWSGGESFLAGVLDRLPLDSYDQPTLLPGWSRRRLVAHVARNADGLNNLVMWARTGIETPMYESAESRDAAIERTAEQAPVLLRADHRDAAARLRAAADQLSPAQWETRVRTAQGRTVPAREIAWMRSREVWVHALDLDDRAGFTDLPADLLEALVEDVLAAWGRRSETVDLVLEASDTKETWTFGRGETAVSAPLADLAALVTGRAIRPDLELPRWL